ncbi:OLC1v1015647C1 [Oldenlandia corymbosa var. corymbosa]|uniref:WAT1-related protein n=1 Tax=Oldenlandia corymbosa var. corymbosa TaxID=529605 RepID=A0AAV1E6T2_OLDCO|nr:OLC1v1015647C1 [Oldenlandia corymbosa var. corymbosa]
MTTVEGTTSGWKPAVMMVTGQVIFSGMNILLKLAANDGMDNRVMVAYRFLFGAAFMVPIALFFERNTRPKLTWKVFLYACLAGLFGGSLGQNLYLQSLVLTSATFISAMLNLVPAVTFVVAVCLRMEKLGWNTAAGKAKILGTIMGIGGAMLFTFYEGPDITFWDTKLNLLQITSRHHSTLKSGGSVRHNLVLGVILALLSCVSYSLWLITQAKAAQVYPAPLSFTALMVLMSAIMSSVFAICMQRKPSQWKLGLDIRLLTVAYAGILSTAGFFTVISLVVRMRGPLFVSVFNPCTLVVVGLVSSMVLEEHIYSGNLLGSILIVCSLYVVLWGKKREDENAKLVPVENVDPTDLEKQEQEDGPKNNADS